MWFRLDSTIRVALIGIAITGVLYAPFWVPLLCMFALSARYRATEVPFIGLFIDLLWLPSIGFMNPFPLFTMLGIVLLWLLEPLRRELLL